MTQAIFPDQIVQSWGYQTKEVGQHRQSPSERQTFGPATIRYQWIKGLNKITASDAIHYYRFEITEEVYENSHAAVERISHLAKSSPAIATKLSDGSVFYGAITTGRVAYVISTDSLTSQMEALPRIELLLKRELKVHEGAEPVDPPNPRKARVR